MRLTARAAEQKKEVNVLNRQEYKTAVDRIIQKEVEAGRIAGACALVLLKGEKLYAGAFGCADLEKKLPMKEDTIFRLFSLTKPITSAAVMLLAERGLLELSDPVSRYLPQFAGMQVWKGPGRLEKASREITLWDLMNMLSGITGPGGVTEPGLEMESIYRELIGRRMRGERVDTQEYLRRIAAVPLLNQPGEKWMYGLSADVLGGVAEVVSGMRFGDFLRKELFDPLDMPDTGFFVPAEKRERLAQIYQWDTEEKRLSPYTGCYLGEYYGEDVAFESGGAGLVSTAEDYSHFACMMLQKGSFKGRRILGKRTVEFMTQNRLTPAQLIDFNWDALRGYGYGCLMRVLMDQTALRANASPGEYGWDGWTGTYVSMSPADDLAVLYFIQRCGAGTTEAVRKIRMASYGMVE